MTAASRAWFSACSCIVLVCSSKGWRYQRIMQCIMDNQLWTSSHVTRIIVIMPPEILRSRANNFITTTALFFNISYKYFLMVQKQKKKRSSKTMLSMYISTSKKCYCTIIDMTEVENGNIDSSVFNRCWHSNLFFQFIQKCKGRRFEPNKRNKCL